MEISSTNQNMEQWNKFLLENESSFLQSFEWGKFQEKLGRKVWRLQIAENEEVVLQALVIKMALPLGKNFLYIPYGPCCKHDITNEQEKQAIGLLFEELEKIAKIAKSVYCYIEPFKALGSLNFKEPSFKEPSALQKPQKRVQPQKTLILDITQSEEDIFKGIQHKTTRYNIRFAEKQGVKFVEAEPTLANIDIFYNLLQKTSQRDKFNPYTKDYFTKLFSQLTDPRALSVNRPQGSVSLKLCFAEWQRKIVAASVLAFFGKRATYLYAASDYQYRNLMAPYFLQWKQILLAKKMGCTEYDFWGIDEKKWPGITYFKKSFGGKEVEYPEGVDIVFQKGWYEMYKMARMILR